MGEGDGADIEGTYGEGAACWSSPEAQRALDTMRDGRDEWKREEATNLAYEADRLLREGDVAGARDHYARAAMATERELAAYDKHRGRALLAENAVRMWLKAGRPDEAERVVAGISDQPLHDYLHAIVTSE